jgi:hypothetical protein
MMIVNSIDVESIRDALLAFEALVEEVEISNQYPLESHRACIEEAYDALDNLQTHILQIHSN